MNAPTLIAFCILSLFLLFLYITLIPNEVALTREKLILEMSPIQIETQTTKPPPIHIETGPLPLCRYLGDEMEGEWDQRWWQPKNCTFKKYSQDEARKCIAGKSIAIIGDSTSHGIWRDGSVVFGEGFIYSEGFDYEKALAMRRAGDPKVVQFTSRYFKQENALIRFYSMWTPSMWYSTGYPGARDNANKTIQDVLRNSTIDLVILNIGAHSQFLPLPGNVKMFVDLMDNIAKFYKENFTQKKMVPLLWNTMNAHYPPKKPQDKRYQTALLSKIYNDISYYQLGREKVPIIDFHPLMTSNIIETSRDGVHSNPFVDIMKNQMVLNYLCNSGNFSTDFLLGKAYHERVLGYPLEEQKNQSQEVKQEEQEEQERQEIIAENETSK